MVQYGTVHNGVIVPEGPAFPEGTRVRLEAAEVEEDYSTPPTDTYEEHLTSLRESIPETEAGIDGIDARQFLKELAIKHGLPLLPGE